MSQASWPTNDTSQRGVEARLPSPKAIAPDVASLALSEMITVCACQGCFTQRLTTLLLRVPASSLGRSLVALDHDLAHHSLREAALRRLSNFGVHARIVGPNGDVPLDQLDPTDGVVPRSGPVLVLSNHPGLFDALALFAAVGREDLAALAARRPLLEALPNLSRRLLAIDPGASACVALRKALRHLAAGGALLHFPAGHIEPDPRIAPPGTLLVHPWQGGVHTLITAGLRACPDLRVCVAVVSGVISRRALWLVRSLGGARELSDALVPLLQLSLPGFTDVEVCIRCGAPEDAREVGGVDRLHVRARALAAAAARPKPWMRQRGCR